MDSDETIEIFLSLIRLSLKFEPLRKKKTPLEALA